MEELKKRLEAVKSEIEKHHDEGRAWTEQVIDEAIYAISDNGWISVKDRLPDLRGRIEYIYITDTDGNVNMRLIYPKEVSDYEKQFDNIVA